MTIDFYCKTNKDYVMINTAKFTLPNGIVLTIDRDETNYNIDDNGNLSMDWQDCYLLAINGYNIFEDKPYLYDDGFGEIDNFLKGATVEFELEDDADEDYEVTDIEWELDSF